MKKKILGLLYISLLGLIACKGNVDTAELDKEQKKEYPQPISIEAFLDENNIIDRYPDLKFTIKEAAETEWLSIESFDFLAEDVVPIINLAESNSIVVNAKIGNVYMISGTYITGVGENGSNWIVMGYGLDNNREEPTSLGFISEEEMLEIYAEHKADLPCQKALEEVMKGACLTVYHSDALEKESWIKEPHDYVDEQFFVNYYEYISQLSPIDMEKGNSSISQYFFDNYSKYVIPINHYNDGHKVVYQYLQGNLVIDTETWTSMVEIVDNSKLQNNNASENLLAVSDDDIYLAVINTYYSLKNFMNGKDVVGFDTKALQIIAEHFDRIQEWNLFEAPLCINNYSSTQGGHTIQFDYDANVSIVWDKDQDYAYVLCH